MRRHETPFAREFAARQLIRLKLTEMAASGGAARRLPALTPV
jgi:hypothetical protein